MKAVMISIRPEWCEKIANGKKTIEIRKTSPKLQPPFKCYIYCTERGRPLVYGDVQCWGGYREEYTQTYGYSKERARKIWDVYNGHVMGEFVCDAVFPICVSYSDPNNRIALSEFPFTCLTDKQIMDYLGNGKTGYGWHISDLKIYDTPKDLSEFYVWKKCNSCRKSGYESTACGYDEDCKVPAIIERPPQSWCYVEDIG